jgi:small-conductance mechanosensitive channel
MESNAGAVTTLSSVGFVLQSLLWMILLLVALDNFGINVTTLVAGLGISGIAVALAVQNILGDLFASFSIVFDKPFVIGDFIIVGDFLGTVEYVGLKTTRIRSLSGEQLIFSNGDLLKSRIRNFKRMYERRVVFTIGVLYQTTYEQLIEIPKMIRSIIESQGQVRFDRAHFKEYGAYSLNFEVVYWIQNPDYNVYMDIQQAINLTIFKQFKEKDIHFAYPTQTLFIENDLSPVIDFPSAKTAAGFRNTAM